ncbi:MAG: hypothetical protein WAQ22_02675 [Candidatus Saccharimonas sp.]
MKRKFTIELELENITKQVDGAVRLCYSELYGNSDTYGLTCSGATKLLNKIPATLHRSTKEILKAYSTIIKDKDIQTIHDYIETQRRHILKITSPDKLEFDGGVTHDGELADDMYAGDRKRLVAEFNNKIKTVHQRIDNEFLRADKRRREIWIPIVISSSLSIIAIIISVISLGMKNG